MSNSLIPRLIYLAAEHRPPLPRSLMKYCPQGDVILAVGTKGVQGAQAELDLPLDQLKNLYHQGKAPNKGDVHEFKTLLSSIISAELDLKKDELPMTEYLGRMSDVSAYLKGGQALVAFEEVSLGKVDATQAEGIPKWNSGFSPLDVVLGGCYQGIIMLMAPPGGGKTTLMLSVMEEARKTGIADEIWYYELEIPMKLMLYRASPCIKRTKFKETDRLVCGYVTMQDIIKQVEDRPNPERIIILDSPDVMASGSGEGKRFVIEAIYRDLIRLKSLCKAVFVTSWPRRKDGALLTLNSPSESAAKAWFSDIVVGAVKLGRLQQGFTNVRLNVPKNRFGIADQELTFGYNYSTLEWELSQESVQQMEGDDW